MLDFLLLKPLGLGDSHIRKCLASAVYTLGAKVGITDVLGALWNNHQEVL